MSIAEIRILDAFVRTLTAPSIIDHLYMKLQYTDPGLCSRKSVEESRKELPSLVSVPHLSKLNPDEGSNSLRR